MSTPGTPVSMGTARIDRAGGSGSDNPPARGEAGCSDSARVDRIRSDAARCERASTGTGPRIEPVDIPLATAQVAPPPVAVLPALRATRLLTLPLADGTALPVQLLDFEEAHFADDAFTTAGIHRPESVARSVRKRQAEFFFGRLAAQRALRALDPAMPTAIAIGPAREPLWPDGIVGSISHTRGLAAATALARGRWRGVGIDLEQVVDASGRAALLATVVDAGELALLREHAAAAQGAAEAALDTLLTAVFSAKESLFKGAYVAVGEFFDFSAARVVALDPAAGRLQLRLARGLGSQFQQGQTCELGLRRLDARTLLTCFAW